MQIPDGLQLPLQDSFSQAWSKTAQSKTNEKNTEPAQVISYDPLTHTAMVKILRAGYTAVGIRVRGVAHYQGADPGTGEAAAHYPGQQVDVAFLMGSSFGVFNMGQIVGTKYTHQDHHAPAYPPFSVAGTGTVKVYPNGNGGWGNAHHVDDQSNVSKTTVAKVNHEDWGNEHVLGNGSSKTRSQELTEKASAGILGAANTLLTS